MQKIYSVQCRSMWCICACSFLLLAGAQQAVDSICGFVAATNIASLYSQWQCSSSGVPITSPCSASGWPGIYCNAIGSAITDISLVGEGLQGTIASNIGDLTGLEEVNLASNFLIGIIPNSISQLQQLTLLALYQNKLN